MNVISKKLNYNNLKTYGYESNKSMQFRRVNFIFKKQQKVHCFLKTYNENLRKIKFKKVSKSKF